MQAGVKADLKASQGECFPDDWVAAKELRLSYCNEKTRLATTCSYHGNLIIFLNSNPDEDSIAPTMQGKIPAGREEGPLD